MKYKLLIILSSLTFCLCLAQNKKSISINWKKDITEVNENLKTISKPYFDKAFYPKSSSFPYYIITEIVDGRVKSATIEINQTKKEIVNKSYNELNFIKSSSVKTEIKRSGNQSIIHFLIPTYQKNLSSYEKIISFEYSFSYSLSSSDKKVSKTNFRSNKNSVMSNGEWHKIGVTSTGIQKLTYSFFVENGISVNNLNPKYLRIYGYSEGMLSESIK